MNPRKHPLAFYTRWIAFVVLSCSVLVTTTVFAQGSRTPSGSTGAPIGGGSGSSSYDFSIDGELPMNVNIWGAVQHPGKYRVSQSTKLIQLISLAGGPTEKARLEEIRILHDRSVDSTIKDPVTIFNFEEYQRTGDTRLNPILFHNDTVIIPNNSFSTFMEILGVIRDIATIITSIVGLYVLFRNQNN